ncbi:MAG: response regulator [bacterium]|nr:response regulator [bacterium]
MAGETLFVIDDDPFMRSLLADSLSDEGFTVIVAENGQDALQKINQNEFEIVLLDLSLPDMGGMELLAHISGVSPEAQVIIMTGYPSLESAIDALREGAQDYIVKPFKMHEVQAAVSRALKNRQLQIEVRELRRRVRELEQEASRLRTTASPTESRPTATRTARLPGAYGTRAAQRPPPPEPKPEPEPEPEPKPEESGGEETDEPTQ